MSEPKAPRWITVATYSARYLAELPIQSLEGAGIPVLVKGEEPGIWGPAFAGPTSQGVTLLVPSEAKQEALEILEGFAGDPEDDDDED